MTPHVAALPLPLPYPFDLAFMQRALAAGLVVGAFAPLIGTFLVQKRLSLIGDGIGHLAFAGVAIGAVTGIYPLGTALVVSTAGAVGLERLRARRKASGDLALALFFYSGIALGIVLLVYSIYAQDHAARTAAFYILIGVPLWLTLAVVFDPK